MSTELRIIPGVTQSFGGMGPFELRVEEDGELIKRTEIGVGWQHRGIERCFENFNYLLGNSLADKVDFMAAPACNLAYALAVERLSGIDVPEPAQYTRVLLLELNRVASHLHYVAQIASCVGSSIVRSFALREREKYCDIFEMYCGSRMLFNAIRIGGVADVVTEGILYRVETTLGETARFLGELNRMLTKNPVFADRLAGLAPISRQTALEYGLSGPNARSAGLDSDLRRERPYAAYDRIAFESVAGERKSGDCLDRFAMRLHEIAESRGIIEKILRRIPSGNHVIPIGPQFNPPRGDAYVEVESPRGSLGVYLESNGTNRPARVKFMPPSFFSLRLVPVLLREQMIEDAELIFAGMDISFSEVDR